MSKTGSANLNLLWKGDNPTTGKEESVPTIQALRVGFSLASEARCVGEAGKREPTRQPPLVGKKLSHPTRRTSKEKKERPKKKKAEKKGGKGGLRKESVHNEISQMIPNR